MKSDDIDGVQLVRRIRDEQQEVLKGKTPEERRALYAERARRLHKRLGVKHEKRSQPDWTP